MKLELKYFISDSDQKINIVIKKNLILLFSLLEVALPSPSTKTPSQRLPHHHPPFFSLYRTAAVIGHHLVWMNVKPGWAVLLHSVRVSRNRSSGMNVSSHRHRNQQQQRCCAWNVPWCFPLNIALRCSPAKTVGCSRCGLSWTSRMANKVVGSVYGRKRRRMNAGIGNGTFHCTWTKSSGTCWRAEPDDSYWAADRDEPMWQHKRGFVINGGEILDVFISNIL